MILRQLRNIRFDKPRMDAMVLTHQLTKYIMGRLTITLQDSLHQALKEAAARQGRTIGTIIEESLQLRGIKPIASARALVARSKVTAYLTEAEAIDLGVSETQSVRNQPKG